MGSSLIGGLVAAGVVVILILFGCCYWRRKLRRARTGSTNSGKAKRMEKRKPKTWTTRLKRWTGYPTATHITSPDHNHTDAGKNTTKVTVEPDDVVPDTSQKRFATIEREGHKQASNPTQSSNVTANDKKSLDTSVSSPPPVCPRPDVGQTNANIEKEPVRPSASSQPAVAPRPDERKAYDERKTYVSVKKQTNNVHADDDDDYMDVPEESRKPVGDSPPAVAERPDDKPYVSVLYPGNKANIAGTVEPAYVDKDATAAGVRFTETPDYIDIKSGGDVSSANHEKTASYVVVEPGSSAAEQRMPDVEQDGYVDLTRECNQLSQPTGSSDTLLRGRAGRQHDSVTGKDDDSGKDARAGLKTWANDKTGAVSDKDTDRNCMTYMSVVGDKETLHEAPDSTAYLSVVPTDTRLSDAEQPAYVDITPGVGGDTPTSQSGGSSDTLLRGRAGRQHDSLTGKDDDSGKDTRAGLKTWANRPEKAAVTNDKAYVSVMGDKGANMQGTTDCATYVNVVPTV